MLDHFLRELAHPEYVHVLLNPIPIYGTAFGALALLVSLFCKSPRAKIPPLILLLAAGLSIWPVLEYGHRAESRVEAQFDPDGREWFETHEARAEKVEPLFYALAGLAVMALVCGGFFPKSSTPLGILVLLLALACLGAGAWVGYAGGKIMHREFRTGPPPPAESAEAR